MRDSGGSVAGLEKLKQSGSLCDAFANVVQSEGLELADAALGVGRLLVTHDRQSDLQNSKKAGFLTSSVMNVAVKRIEDNVDKQKVRSTAPAASRMGTLLWLSGQMQLSVCYTVKLNRMQFPVHLLPVLSATGCC